MQTIRPPAVAGSFYPADRNALRAAVQAYLAGADASGVAPKAIIVPHAGYVYSGPVAASAYRQLAACRASIRRVVLLGPSHRVGFAGLAVPGCTAFATPLGEVPVDREALRALADLPFVHEYDRAHASEHSLEVQLPFLQELLEAWAVAPLVVGDATPAEVAEVLDRLWGGDETLIVVSSDLSHYRDYQTATRQDRRTSRAIEEGRADAIGYDDACGRLPVCGLLLAAKRRDLHATVVDLRNSGDTAGPRDRVVGYGAYVLS